MKTERMIHVFAVLKGWDGRMIGTLRPREIADALVFAGTKQECNEFLDQKLNQRQPGVYRVVELFVPYDPKDLK